MQTTIRRRAAIGALISAALGTTPALVQAQDTRPIRIVVGFTAGGSVDAGARTIAPLLEARLKQQVVVDNRPGGNGMIAVQTVLGAPADGNTLYMQGLASISKAFIKDMRVDVMRELEPVAPMWSFSYFLLSNASLPARNAKEFVDYAKAHRGQLNYAASTASGMLTMEMLKSVAGVDLVQVPYKGSAPAVLGMLGNDVQATFDTIGVYKPHVDAGKVHVLLFTGRTRSSAMPDVPTAAEAGLPQLTAGLTGGFWTRAGAPADKVARINAAVQEIMALPQVRARFETIGWSPTSGSAADLGRTVAAERVFWEDAANRVGYKPE